MSVICEQDFTGKSQEFDREEARKRLREAARAALGKEI